MIQPEEKPLLILLMDRIERISADSIWAHRASGVRNAMFRILDEIEGKQSVSQSDLMRLIEQAIYILAQAAKEKGKIFHEK